MEKELYTKIYQIEKTHWWYVGRRTIIFDWFFRVLGKNLESKILDVGCGTGYNIEFLKGQGYIDVYGLDFAPEALEFCSSRGLQMVTCGNLAELPYASETFDMITALDIIEHLDDDLQGLAELKRILKPGGKLVIFVPALMFLWSLQDDVSHHRRRYNAQELQTKVRQVGLEIDKLTYANSLLFPVVLVGRLLLRLVRDRVNLISEADMSPNWSNGILGKLFSFEMPLLRWFNFPIGVSLLCVCHKSEN